MIRLTEQQIIEDLARRLADAHTEVEPTEVARVVKEQHARFADRPIRDFVPLFVERNAKAELQKLDS
ncbi:three-helix bundle dimerization domain-containing protein [Mycobacterium sp. SMC-4]|uniref:three-helix bundle dimerization domain-containing protein n=1 Tax=Mycobacterium sp. SMC-4 TaxID=2857059 RepID=UPI003D073909